MTSPWTRRLGSRRKCGVPQGCAPRTPGQAPPADRDRAEANFKRLNLSHKILLRVGKAIREEAESGNAENAIAEQQRMEAEAAREEEARMAVRLKSVCLSTASLLAGPGPKVDSPRWSASIAPAATWRSRWSASSHAAVKSSKPARGVDADGDSSVASSPRVSWARFCGLCERRVRRMREELREVAEGLRAAIRFMGRELAAAIGRPEDGDEMADDLELAFLEGRMSVNDAGGLEVLVPDDEEPGMYYKLSMSSNEDGAWRCGRRGRTANDWTWTYRDRRTMMMNPRWVCSDSRTKALGGEVRFEGEEPG